MNIALKIEQPEFAASEVRNTLAYALRTEAEQAQWRRDHYAEICTTFEQEYQLTSDEFLVRFECGEMDDDAYLFDWFAAKRGFDVWQRRHQILSMVSL